MVRHKTCFHAMHERVFICWLFDMRQVAVFAKMPSDHVGCFAPFSMWFYLLVMCFLLCTQSEKPHRCWGFLFACHLLVICQNVIGSSFDAPKLFRHVFVSFANMCFHLPRLRPESDFCFKGVNTLPEIESLREASRRVYKRVSKSNQISIRLFLLRYRRKGYALFRMCLLH